MIIYKLTNTINGKSYIGLTRQSLQKRWSDHISNSKKYHTHLYIDILSDREKYWISHYNTFGKEGYNETSGGEGGYTFREDVKQKIKTKRKHQILPPHTEEWKQEQSARRIGKRPFEMTNQIRENMSIGQKKRFQTDTPWNKGKQLSEITRLKMSQIPHLKKTMPLDFRTKLLELKTIRNLKAYYKSGGETITRWINECHT